MCSRGLVAGDTIVPWRKCYFELTICKCPKEYIGLMECIISDPEWLFLVA